MVTRGPEKNPGSSSGVEVVPGDLQRRADHRTHGQVELGDFPAHLHHLPVREPEGLLPQGVLQPDGDPVRARVHIRRGGEGEHHPREGAGLRLQKHAADECGDIVPAGHDFDLVNADRRWQAGDSHPDGIRDPVAVELLSVTGQRVRHITDIPPLTDRDPLPKAVLDGRQPVDVVAEIMYGQEFLPSQPADDLSCSPVRAAEEVDGDLIHTHRDGLAPVVAVEEEIDVPLGPRLVGGGGRG